MLHPLFAPLAVLLIFGNPVAPCVIAPKIGKILPTGPRKQLDILEKNAYNHNNFTAKMPQQYFETQHAERDPLAGRAPVRSKGRTAAERGRKRPRPPPRTRRNKGGISLEFGWHHEANERYRPKVYIGRTVLFFKL